MFHYMNVSQCVYFAVDGHLGCFRVSAITNNVGINVLAYMFWLICARIELLGH